MGVVGEGDRKGTPCSSGQRIGVAFQDSHVIIRPRVGELMETGKCYRPILPLQKSGYLLKKHLYHNFTLCRDCSQNVKKKFDYLTGDLNL